MRAILFTLMISLLANVAGCAEIQGSGNSKMERVDIDRDLRKIEFGVAGDMEIISGDKNQLVVSGDDNVLQYIEVEIRGDRLEISNTGRAHYRTREPLHFTLELRNPDSLENLGVYGSGSLSAKKLAPKEMSLNISGSGDLYIESLDTGELESSISGSGNLVVSGEAISQELSIAGSGDYRAAKLNSRKARVDIMGSGDAEMSVSESLKVHIMGSGDVNVRGNPAVSKSLSGSGDVRLRDS